MDALALFRTVRAAGGTLRMSNGTLMLEGARVIPDDVKAEIRENRALVRDILIAALSCPNPEHFLIVQARFQRGVEILFDMECAGRMGTPTYEKRFTRWLDLKCAAELLSSGSLTEAPAWALEQPA